MLINSAVFGHNRPEVKKEHFPYLSSLNCSLEEYIEEVGGVDIAWLKDPRFDPKICIRHSMNAWKLAAEYQIKHRNDLTII